MAIPTSAWASAGAPEPLVDVGLFEKAASLVLDRRHSKMRIKRVFPVKGLLRCGDCGSVMTPHYVQKRRRDGSVNRIVYHRCTKTMHFNNQAYRTKHLNAAEESCRGDLSNAQKQEAWTGLKEILQDWMSEPWFEVAVPDRGNLERLLTVGTTMF